MADYSLDVRNSGTVDVDSDVHLDGLDDIKVDTTLDTAEPASTLNSESDVTLHSDATARLTLDPVTTTSSTRDGPRAGRRRQLRARRAGAGGTHVVRSPWEQRVGFSLCGVELAAISWCGQSTTYVEPVPPRPLVVGPTRRPPCAPRRRALPRRRAHQGGLMRQTADLPDLVVRAPGDGPVILAGAPGRLRGAAARHEHRPAAEPPAALRRAGSRPAGPARSGPARRPAVSRRRHRGHRLARARPADTPPGEYHATLDVAGHEVEAILHVSRSRPST